MWRYGFNTPPNYNDHELYCGGEIFNLNIFYDYFIGKLLMGVNRGSDFVQYTNPSYGFKGFIY